VARPCSARLNGSFIWRTHDEGMTDVPAAWMTVGLVVREDGGSVPLSELEAVWEAVTVVCQARGLRLASTRSVPLSADELAVGDLPGIMRDSGSGVTQPL